MSQELNPIIIEQLKKYEALMIDKRGIERDLEVIKEVIVPELSAEKPIETDMGIFTIESRSKWKYTDDIIEAEKELKEKKKLQEQNGEAEEVKGEPYLVYRLKTIADE